VIFANGQVPDRALDELRPEDWLIAADGGARHCVRRGLTPHVLIGDLDSLEASERYHLERAGVEQILHPARKDHTDQELALHVRERAPASSYKRPEGAGTIRWPTSPSGATTGNPPLSQQPGCQRAVASRGDAPGGAPGDIVSLRWGDAVGVTTEG
jgi:thiamine pyrophosphokinase